MTRYPTHTPGLPWWLCPLHNVNSQRASLSSFNGLCGHYPSSVASQTACKSLILSPSLSYTFVDPCQPVRVPLNCGRANFSLFLSAHSQLSHPFRTFTSSSTTCISHDVVCCQNNEPCASILGDFADRQPGHGQAALHQAIAAQLIRLHRSSHGQREEPFPLRSRQVDGLQSDAGNPLVANVVPQTISGMATSRSMVQSHR